MCLPSAAQPRAGDGGAETETLNARGEAADGVCGFPEPSYAVPESIPALATPHNGRSMGPAGSRSDTTRTTRRLGDRLQIVQADCDLNHTWLRGFRIACV